MTTGNVDGTGTLFKFTTGGTLTTLYTGCELACGVMGAPAGSLIQASDGSLYGTSFAGGENVKGSIFKIGADGTPIVLYSFCSLPNCADGTYPVPGLVEGRDGDFYGTTTAGGSTDYGTVFRFSRDGTLTTLHSFCFEHDYPVCSDGSEPNAPLILASDGNLYGTTSSGGTNACIVVDCGTLFKITPDGNLSTVYNFTDASSFFPGMILEGTNGAFYGIDVFSVVSGTDGAIFSLSLGLPPFVETIPAGGLVGRTVNIIGQGLTGTTSVTINQIAVNYTVISDTLIRAVVPPNATTGQIAVTTPTGILDTIVPFHVIR